MWKRNGIFLCTHWKCRYPGSHIQHHIPDQPSKLLQTPLLHGQETCSRGTKSYDYFEASLFFFFLFPLSRGRLHVPEGSCWGSLPQSCSRDRGKHTLGSFYPSGRIACIFHPGTGGPVLSQIHASVSKAIFKKPHKGVHPGSNTAL